MIVDIGARRRSFALGAVGSSVAVAAAMLLSAGEARAGASVAVDGGLAIPVGGSGAYPLGFGVDGRLGYRIGLAAVWLTPELDGGLRKFGGGTLGRIMGGLRFGVSGVVQPHLFAHAGYAFGDVKGFSFRGGFGLDFKIVPLVTLGVHGSFNMITADAGPSGPGDALFKWVDVGPSVGFHF